MIGLDNYFQKFRLYSTTGTIIILFFMIGCRTPSFTQDIPNSRISNGTIIADIKLPDPEKGYYRGSRFDWSGVMSQLEYSGHTYFGQWFEKYDPYLHDAIMGPVEAFDPLGYDDAGVGETFTKIGIGILERLDTAAYRFSKPYKIVDHGRWNVVRSKDRIEFKHELTKGDYPYRYSKIVRLVDNKMIIDHTLMNTGNNLIDTQVFNHNFIIIDHDTIGPGYIVQFPFEVEGDPSGLGEFAVLEGNKVRFVKPLLAASDHARLRTIKGYGDSASDYKIVIENKKKGAGVRISCDRPLSHLLMWSAPKSLSPEPYIMVNVLPSQSFTWSITYEFYTL